MNWGRYQEDGNMMKQDMEDEARDGITMRKNDAKLKHW
jgi:hypothetical protein